MLHTLEAEIDQNGQVRLLESVRLAKPCRALVTLLEQGDDEQDSSPTKGNPLAALEYLHATPLPVEARWSPEEIEAQIEEERHAWD